MSKSLPRCGTFFDRHSNEAGRLTGRTDYVASLERRQLEDDWHFGFVNGSGLVDAEDQTGADAEESGGGDGGGSVEVGATDGGEGAVA